MIESSISASAYSSTPRQQRCVLGQPDHGPGRDRVQLPHMTELERPEERSESRWCITGIEDTAHPTVPQDGQVIDAVRTRNHARNNRRDLQPCVRALVRWDRQELIHQLPQTHLVGQRDHWHQPGCGHQIRFVEHRAAHRAGMR